MNTIYLIVGVPGSGKSWVCDQLKDKYEHVAHDDYQSGGYLTALMKAASIIGGKPVLAETPFSVSQIVGPLETAGFTVIPVFILERNSTVSSRYEAREGRPIPKGHLTRQITYAQRADELGAFRGSSEDVLAHLKGL